MLQHKTVVVTGIANSESIAFSAAVRASAAGARLVLAAFPRDVDSVRDCAEQLPGNPPVLPLDLTDVGHVEDVRRELREAVGHLDGALHAVAFAPRETLESFVGVPTAKVEIAFRTSAHIEVQAYNWMGVCKAALESANQYLARHLGPRRVRSNLVAAGPLITRAASAIRGFGQLLGAWEQAPLPWGPKNPTPVADAACFLLSDLSAAFTGEILHVDGGHHVLAATASGGAG